MPIFWQVININHCFLVYFRVIFADSTKEALEGEPELWPPEVRRASSAGEGSCAGGVYRVRFVLVKWFQRGFKQAKPLYELIRTDWWWSRPARDDQEEMKRIRSGFGSPYMSGRAAATWRLLSSGCFSEIRIRRVLGDSPSTSKALRKWVSEVAHMIGTWTVLDLIALQ
jgi:hypothetical protein